MLEGYYYLHENKDLIFKRGTGDMVADFRESDFVIAFWPMSAPNRQDGWTILVEGSVAGAKPERIMELATRWGCNDADAAKFAEFSGFSVFLDGVEWFATPPDFVNLQESLFGHGPTALHAIVDLCKALGYEPSKMWGASFQDLIDARKPKAPDA